MLETRAASHTRDNPWAALAWAAPVAIAVANFSSCQVPGFPGAGCISVPSVRLYAP